MRCLVGLVVAGAVSSVVGCGAAAKSRPDLLFVSSRTGVYAIYAMDADGSRSQRLSKDVPKHLASTADLFFQVDPTWSPDGTQIAFSSNRSGTSQIYVMQADGSATKQLTSLQGGGSAPAWSPEGARIAFVRYEPGMVYLMSANGTGAHRLGKGDGNESDPAWSPDGTRIAFVRRAPGESVTELWTSAAHGSGARQLTRLGHAVSSPSWSPDGRRIAFAADRRGRFEIYVVRADGTALRRLTASTGEDVDPSWSPDGSRIAFSRDGAITTVDLVGKLESLTKTKDNDSGPAWKPRANDPGTPK